MDNKYITLPLIAIKDTVILKGEIVTLDISKKKSMYALEYALDEEKDIFFTLEKNSKKQIFNDIGIIGKIKEYSDVIPSIRRVVIEGTKGAYFYTIFIKFMI